MAEIKLNQIPSSEWLNQSGLAESLSVACTSTYRINASWESFAQNHYVWVDSFMVDSQPATRPGQSGLDFVCDPEHLEIK